MLGYSMLVFKNLASYSTGSKSFIFFFSSIFSPRKAVGTLKLFCMPELFQIVLNSIKLRFQNQLPSPHSASFEEGCTIFKYIPLIQQKQFASRLIVLQFQIQERHLFYFVPAKLDSICEGIFPLQNNKGNSSSVSDTSVCVAIWLAQSNNEDKGKI